MPEMTHGPGTGTPKSYMGGTTHMSARSPEVTFSTDRGPRDPPSPIPIQPSPIQEARTTRLLLGVTLTTGATLGFLGVVLLQLIVALVTAPGPKPEPTKTGGPQCHDGVDGECGDDEVCLGGRCIAARRAPACQIGDPCEVADAKCSCGGDLRCVEHECRAPAPSSSATCDDAAVAEVLKGIADTCNGDLGTCDADKLEKFAVESRHFDAVLAKFPTTITVHFPDKSPPPSGGPAVWPVDAMRAHYQARLSHRFVAEALAKAEDILLIGRSSEGGQAQENYEYSRLRVEVVKDLLLDNTRSQSEQKALLGKIHKVLLSNHRVIEPDFFRKHFTNRLIGWSSPAEETLRANIAEYDALQGRARVWTNRIMNQVVFVVPLPCKLPRAEAHKD